MDIKRYLKYMVDKQASDLFFTVGAPVNIKINGQTNALGQHVLDSNDCRDLAYSLLTKEQISTYEHCFELNLAASFPDIGRFRVNVYRQRGEVAMVVRHIKSLIPDVEELGLPPILKELILEKSGLILVVGATGSGKSTTLASMIDHRNSQMGGHILTVEDPVEFVHSHKKSMVDQREVGLDTRSYADALKNALRESPDVIVVGEIRDQETMQHAIHYAETGHICLSTLHATNTYKAMDRILNFFPEEAHRTVLMDLSQHLRAIVAQRLVEGVDGQRIPAVEVLLNTPYVAELIDQGRLMELQSALERSEHAGMMTFDDALFDLVQANKISAESALRSADSRNNLRLRLHLEGTSHLEISDDLSLERENKPGEHESILGRH
jgi:twitching motility protein PilU